MLIKIPKWGVILWLLLLPLELIIHIKEKLYGYLSFIKNKKPD